VDAKYCTYTPELAAMKNLPNTGTDPETDLYFYHGDHLGSSSFITDASAYPTQHLQYLPFGEDYIHQQNSSNYFSPFTFSAKERDLETDLSYFGARYYEAGLSIWLSVDPLADKQANLSPYHYCAGNPVILKDPDGKHPIIIGALIGGLVEVGSQVVSNVTQGKSAFKDLDYADIGIAMAEGAYIGSGAGLVGKLVSSAGTALLKASVDANSTGVKTILPGLGKEKDKKDFGKELGAALVGGAFGRLFDNELGHLLLDGLIDGGLKEISTVLELKKGITLKEVVVKPEMTDEELFQKVIKENRVLQEIHDMHPCIGCRGVFKPEIPELLD